MKKISVSLIGAAVITVSVTYGQGTFQDLDFEAARPMFITNYGGILYIAATNAFPGWAVFDGTNQLSEVQYNPSLGGSFFAVGLSSPGLTGNFSVALSDFGGYGLISQTGQVPVDAKSLLFVGTRSGWNVSVSGQNLSYVVVSNLLAFNGFSLQLYAADISAFVGRTVTLAFSQSAVGGYLDDIQFSSVPVPEPGGLDWLALGSGVLVYVIRRRHR